MKQMEKNRTGGKIAHLFRWLGRKIIHLFEPEEVEVTFKQVGKHIHYTYTKVEHKQVA